jgi:PAB-dependent poly(A)-specific ribonuclease subunit 2
VLYFIPPLRAAILAHAPEPSTDFCMACELMFLFRMLFTAAGTPCQASNLLRALKQNREAAALGLLDGAGGPGGGAGGVESRVLEAEAKQQVLARRFVSLSRFLLEHLHK